MEQGAANPSSAGTWLVMYACCTDVPACIVQNTRPAPHSLNDPGDGESDHFTGALSGVLSSGAEDIQRASATVLPSYALATHFVLFFFVARPGESDSQQFSTTTTVCEYPVAG